MSNQVALFNGEQSVVMSSKTGKTGSFAKAIAFADRQSRLNLSSMIYVNQLSNGTYRPIVNDILSSSLLPKAVGEVAQAFIPPTGPVPKANLMQLCEYVEKSVQVKRMKAEQAGKSFELKGQNAFLYGLIERIAESAKSETVDA